MRPLEAEATVRKRMAEDAQTLLDLDKQRFEITEQGYKAELIAAHRAAGAPCSRCTRRGLYSFGGGPSGDLSPSRR